MMLAKADSREPGGRLTAALPLSSLLLSSLLLGAPLLPGAEAWADSSHGKRVSDEVAEKVRGAGRSDLIPVIVQTNSDPSEAHLGRLRGHGGALKTKHQSINGYAAQVPAEGIAALAEDPDVERISYDAPVRALLDVALKAVHGDLAPAGLGGLTGSGIGIALIDTGVQEHADLQRTRLPEQIQEVEIVGREKGLADYYGHGTHVAGILAGNGAASSGEEAFRTFRGVAPGARLISLRALQPDGSGTTSDVLAAIDWVVTHRRAHNIRVLNLSLGHPVYESYVTDPLCRAVRRAVQAGIVVVTAAGNGGRVGSGFATIVSPANEPSVITVGAMDDSGTVAREDDVLAGYSAKGPTLIDSIVKPDLVAPGSFLVSLRAVGSRLDVGHPEAVLQLGDYSTTQPRDAPGSYLTLSGTSLAAPLVAGTAALMLQQDTDLTPSDVKARLMLSASKDDRLPFETGAGYLDIAAALASTARAGSALSPRAVPDAAGAVALLPLEGAWSGPWQVGLVWGGSRRFGTLAETENDRVTASGIVWGGGNSSATGAGGALDELTAAGIVWGGGNSATDDPVEALGIVWGGGN